MAINHYEEFKKKLIELFMMDHAELDFGIYRIMNQKRDEINSFLEQQLLPQVKEALRQDISEAQDARKRLAEIETLLGKDIDSLPESIPMVSEYKMIQARLNHGVYSGNMEDEVFSHLVTFFSRYYDEGDFLSKRRYKENTYAIPYNGEEVKLYWANSDQYYIKTSEYFRNYSFELPNSHRKVNFLLKDASTEQNNNLAQNNMERRFALWVSDNAEDVSVEATSDEELNIYFTYELMPKDTRQKKLIEEALETIKPLVPEDYKELLSVKVPTKENPDRTLLEKHLTDYTAKNSFDYFIHKDLGVFLSRELDFYIKNELLITDDLDYQHIHMQLSVAKAIKQVGQKIIQMLAQLENLQRKLWLKKKFVTQKDYCITLDRIPKSLYPAIVANDAQRRDWVHLFAIDRIKGDMMKEAYSEPLTIKFLEQNPFLVIDTAYFDEKFKHQLISSFDNIDEQTTGLLINSENFQALELIKSRFSDAVSVHYIDPPFNLNTGADYPYKTNYKDSTWLTILSNRINSCKLMLKDSSLIFVRCDYHGNHFVRHVLEEQGFEYQSEILVSRSRNEAGSSKMDVTHEFLYLYTFPGKEVEKYKVNRSIAEIKWTGFLMAGDRNPPERKFLGVTLRPPRGQHFSLIQDKVDKLLDEHHLRLKCKRCGTLFFKANSTAELSRQMKNRTEQFKFYDIYANTLFEGVLDLSGGCKCGCKDFTVQYLGAPEEFINDNWLDISSYSRNWNFRTENSEELMERVIKFSKPGDLIIDYFGGSCSTLAVAQKMSRKWVGVEMGKQFNAVALPRMKMVLAGEESGISSSYQVPTTGAFKYVRLEQYEDTLNNLEIEQQQGELPTKESRESYMLSYMLNTETRDSLLNLKWFNNPFEMKLKITKDNELIETNVDLVDTFNYLIGLNVETEDWYQEDNICVVKGKTHRDGLKALVIWRNCNVVNNEALNKFFDSMDFCTQDTEFDLIYVNGDNTLPNLRRDEDCWKVVLIEEEFQKRMFEEE